MPADLRPFAASLGLTLTQAQHDQLAAYAACVWAKKDFLNLTSVGDETEIFTRHLADGLVAAAKIQAICRVKQLQHITLADVGAGAGYIGFTLAVALPFAQVTLVESLEKRCRFMNWAALQSHIPVHIKQARLGQGKTQTFDFVTERAMGQLPDILAICMEAVSPNGFFIAFQGEHPQAQDCKLPQNTILLGVENYKLPLSDNKKRHLVLFGKNK